MSEVTYTPKQLEIQAKCFQMLKDMFDSILEMDNALPYYFKDGEEVMSAVGDAARFILEENRAEAFGEEKR